MYQAQNTKYFSVCSTVRQSVSFPNLLPTPDSGFDLAAGNAVLSGRCHVGTLC